MVKKERKQKVLRYKNKVKHKVVKNQEITCNKCSMIIRGGSTGLKKHKQKYHSY